MTQKPGREHEPRRTNPASDAKQLHSPFKFNLRREKNKTSLKVLSRSHKHWTYNRRISG